MMAETFQVSFLQYYVPVDSVIVPDIQEEIITVTQKINNVSTQVDTLNVAAFNDLQKQINDLKTEKSNLMKSMSEIQQNSLKVEIEAEKSPYEKKLNQIITDANENNHSARFLLESFLNYNEESPVWSNDTIQLCSNWRNISPRSFEYYRNHICNIPTKEQVFEYDDTHDPGKIAMHAFFQLVSPKSYAEIKNKSKTNVPANNIKTEPFASCSKTVANVKIEDNINVNSETKVLVENNYNENNLFVLNEYETFLKNENVTCESEINIEEPMEAESDASDGNDNLNEVLDTENQIDDDSEENSDKEYRVEDLENLGGYDYLKRLLDYEKKFDEVKKFTKKEETDIFETITAGLDDDETEKEIYEEIRAFERRLKSKQAEVKREYEANNWRRIRNNKRKRLLRNAQRLPSVAMIKRYCKHLREEGESSTSDNDHDCFMQEMEEFDWESLDEIELTSEQQKRMEERFLKNLEGLNTEDKNFIAESLNAYSCMELINDIKEKNKKILRENKRYRGFKL